VYRQRTVNYFPALISKFVTIPDQHHITFINIAIVPEQTNMVNKIN